MFGRFFQDEELYEFTDVKDYFMYQFFFIEEGHDGKPEIGMVFMRKINDKHI